MNTNSQIYFETSGEHFLRRMTISVFASLRTRNELFRTRM